MPYTLRDLEMPDDEPMVIIRSSLLWICDGDKYAAAALNMYIHWTKWIIKHKPVAQKINQMQKKQGKTPTQDTSLVIYRKQAELVDDLLNFCSEKRLRQVNVFLVSKGLLKVEDMPLHFADHVLKYELQIDTFKTLMNDWRKYREGNQLSEEDEMVEVALEADKDRTDNLPLGNGKVTARTSSPNGQFTAPKVIDNKLIDKKQIGSTALRANNNASSVSEKVNEEKTPLTEKEQQIIKWFCEVSGMTSVNMTRKAAQESMIAILPEIESIDDMRGLYEQAKNDIAARSDATNKTVYLANLKDALFNWKQNKPVVQPTIPEMPELTEEELDEKVLWTSSPSAARRLFADGATMREHMEDRYCKPRWMSRRDAREYDYDMPEVQHYTLDQQAEYRQLAGRQELAIAG